MRDNGAVPRLRLLLLPLLATLVIAAPAAGATTHRDSAVGSVKQQSAKGSTIVYTGTMKSSLLGRGRIRQVVRLEGATVTGSYTIAYKGGTLRGTIRARASISTKGITFTGTSRVTGGTGRFKGATGNASYSGTAALNRSGTTFRQTGTITF
jgi:hypothetical protein